MTGSGSIYFMCWMIVGVIFIGIAMLTHYHRASQQRDIILRGDIIKLQATLDRTIQQLALDSRRDQRIDIDATDLLSAISNCGRFSVLH